MPPVFELVRELGAVADAEMWEVFNMGCGFCAVVPDTTADAAAALLAAHHPGARRIGTVTDRAGRVEVGGPSPRLSRSGGAPGTPESAFLLSQSSRVSSISSSRRSERSSMSSSSRLEVVGALAMLAHGSSSDSARSSSFSFRYAARSARRSCVRSSARSTAPSACSRSRSRAGSARAAAPRSWDRPYGSHTRSGGILRTVPAYGRSLHPEVMQFLEEVVASIPVDYGGGSGSAKALVIADLIAKHRIQNTVEIGVYRGRSLLPVATMLRISGAGVATGIDPWSAGEALQEETHAVGPEVNEWVRQHDWEGTYQSVVDRIESYLLTDHCRLLRMTSEEAAPQIPDASVGVVHVDGNHDQAAVLRDAELYLPKLSPGGFLVLDDASWDSIRPVVEELRTRLKVVFQLNDFINLHEDQPNDFVVLQTPA